MMKKRTLTLALFAALALLAVPWGSARAGVFIGVGIPGPYYGPYYHRYYYSIYGPRVIIAAPPVYVRPGAGVRHPGPRHGLRAANPHDHPGASGPARPAARPGKSGPVR